ncbi:MAG: hypothetical protein ABIP97_09170 [Chthoniobacterales bacterium]
MVSFCAFRPLAAVFKGKSIEGVSVGVESHEGTDDGVFIGVAFSFGEFLAVVVQKGECCYEPYSENDRGFIYLRRHIPAVSVNRRAGETACI